MWIRTCALIAMAACRVPTITPVAEPVAIPLVEASAIATSVPPARDELTPPWTLTASDGSGLVLTRVAAKAVVDWEGGTRIGDSLTTFVRDWGRRGVCRGGIVVICSDGLDRGDPAVLATAMQRLSRLCYKIVWLNPHVGEVASRPFGSGGGGRASRPNTLGMMVAEPYVDLLLSGHDLRSLEELAARLPELD